MDGSTPSARRAARVDRGRRQGTGAGRPAGAAGLLPHRRARPRRLPQSRRHPRARPGQRPRVVDVSSPSPLASTASRPTPARRSIVRNWLQAIYGDAFHFPIENSALGCLSTDGAARLRRRGPDGAAAGRAHPAVLGGVPVTGPYDRGDAHVQPPASPRPRYRESPSGRRAAAATSRTASSSALRCPSPASCTPSSRRTAKFAWSASTPPRAPCSGRSGWASRRPAGSRPRPAAARRADDLRRRADSCARPTPGRCSPSTR